MSGTVTTTLTIRILLLILALGLSGFATPQKATGYMDDIGYTQLDSELGTATPDGDDVTITQVEASSSGHWMPDTSNSQFTGKTIVDKTSGDTGSSTHATNVGKRLYGSIASMATEIDPVHVYEANNWLQLGFLGFGYTYGGNPFQPVYDSSTLPWVLATPARVANHSWVGSMEEAEYEGNILRLLDFAASVDEYIQVVAVNNGSENKPLLGDSFNGITVGRTDGNHPMGTTDIDGIYVSGRVCPLVVVPLSLTSYTAPVVAAAAALLIEMGRDENLSTDPAAVSTTNRNGEEIFNAERSEVVKAAILAGARRVTYNTESVDQITDYIQNGDNGLDNRFGAGQIDIYNSYHIIANGEQNSAEDQPAGSGTIGGIGFDMDPSFGGASDNTTGSYSFTATTDRRRLYASLVWNLHIDGGTAQNYDDTAVLYDLNLALYDVTVTGYRRLVADSSSTIDNTENLWAALVPGREYLLEVTAASGQDPFDWDYAIAWRMETPPDTDGDGISDDWEVQNGFDYTLASDGTLDPDDDQASNQTEFENGTDPNDLDTDGDGHTDGAEIAAGTDPLDPAAYPATVMALGPQGLVCILILLLVVGFFSVSAFDREKKLL